MQPGLELRVSAKLAQSGPRSGKRFLSDVVREMWVENQLKGEVADPREMPPDEFVARAAVPRLEIRNKLAVLRFQISISSGSSVDSRCLPFTSVDAQLDPPARISLANPFREHAVFLKIPVVPDNSPPFARRVRKRT